jgi:hypothetical protein
VGDYSEAAFLARFAEVQQRADTYKVFVIEGEPSSRTPANAQRRPEPLPWIAPLVWHHDQTLARKQLTPPLPAPPAQTWTSGG